MDDIDFKAKVTRTEFEDLCADLFERVPHPVQEALTTAEMKLVSILQRRPSRTELVFREKVKVAVCLTESLWTNAQVHLSWINHSYFQFGLIHLI